MPAAQIGTLGAARGALQTSVSVPPSRIAVGDNAAMDQRSASDVLEAMVGIFASGDPSGAAEVVASDYLDHQGLGAGPLRGVEGFAHVVRTNRSAYESQSITIEDLFEARDRAVARIRWRGRSHRGEHIDRQTIDIVRVADGRAVEHWGARV